MIFLNKEEKMIENLISSVLYVLGLISLVIGLVGSVWLRYISSNPQAAEQMFVPGIITLSCIEISSISCIGILFQLLAK